MQMKIGVLGAGAMGSGIAQVASTAGHKVLLLDTNGDALKKSKAKLEKVMNRLIEKGRVTPDQAAGIQQRIHYGTALTEFKDCGLVIEAIIENLDIKKSVFSKLESIVSEDCILATNTSSLAVAAIAAACKESHRVIGIHFFNPAPLMKLVEIIPAIQTSPDTLKTSRALIDSWGKLTVVAKDTPGFIVNRIARPFYGEALRIYEEGMADPATIDWVMKELGGFRMGPFELMDYIGNDINFTVTETVFKAFWFDPRYKPAFTQKRLSEAGYLGRKTGKGYYDYSDGAVKPQPDTDAVKGNAILWRIQMMLINEAADALYLNIASKEDIDTAMTKGVNYPKGLLQWADEIGIQKCVDGMDALYDEYREDRYRCSPLLRRMADRKQSFFSNLNQTTV